MGTKLHLIFEMKVEDAWHGLYASPLAEHLPEDPFKSMNLTPMSYHFHGLLSAVRTNPSWGPLLTQGFPPTPSHLTKHAQTLITDTYAYHTPGWISLEDLETLTATGPDMSCASHCTQHRMLQQWMVDVRTIITHLTTTPLTTLPLMGPLPNSNDPSITPFTQNPSAHDTIAIAKALLNPEKHIRMIAYYEG